MLGKAHGGNGARLHRDERERERSEASEREREHGHDMVALLPTLA